MKYNGLEYLGEYEPDGLVIGNFPTADTMSVTIDSTADLKRGSVLALQDDGSYKLMAADGKAAAVLAEDTPAGETETIAYRSAKVARDKLIVADGYELSTADEEELRIHNIVVDAALPY